MKLGFATDIHLDFVKNTPDLVEHRRVGKYIAQGLDVLLIGGDISTGTKFEQQFGAFREGAGIPIYFVLGNHDFWDVSDDVIRATAAKFPGYLDTCGGVELAPGLGLVGCTGWYDTLSGNPFETRYYSSGWVNNDWLRVPRLENCWRVPHLLQRVCRDWAQEETEKVYTRLEEAARRYSKVFVMTHFPCFAAACWDEHGELDAEENGFWPWSINTTLGQALLEVCSNNPQAHFTLLTGHTHGAGRKQLQDNLIWRLGKSRIPPAKTRRIMGLRGLKMSHGCPDCGATYVAGRCQCPHQRVGTLCCCLFVALAGFQYRHE